MRSRGSKRSIDPVQKAVKGGAVARSEQGERETEAEGEKFLRHRWRGGVKDFVGLREGGVNDSACVLMGGGCAA